MYYGWSKWKTKSSQGQILVCNPEKQQILTGAERSTPRYKRGGKRTGKREEEEKKGRKKEKETRKEFEVKIKTDVPAHFPVIWHNLALEYSMKQGKG